LRFWNIFWIIYDYSY